MSGAFVEGTGSKDDHAGTLKVATKQWAYAFVFLLLLSVDRLNPVKMLCHYSTGLVCESQVALVASVGLIGLLIIEAQRLLYYSVRLFFRVNLHNVFFRSVEVIGVENIPAEGPIILTGNHNNQFVDAGLMVTTCPREISFMIAEKSYKRPLIGAVAKAVNAIPVARPQDSAVNGQGTLMINGTAAVQGIGTQFTKQLVPGSQLQLKGEETPLKVKSIASDTELELAQEVSSRDSSSGVTYKVLPKIDHGKMYDAVFGCLQEGRCFGIFPEGGSHDRTDLLPLKAGVAIIALEVYKKHSLRVPIIPVGLNYFQGHRFRGRVVIEFGAPIWIEEELYTQHETDKRGAMDVLLQQVTMGMRSVIVPTSDFKELQMLYTTRRLFVRDGRKLSPKETLDLDRRFAKGLQQLMNGNDGDHESRSIFEDLKGQISDYMATLKRLGLRDHQVQQIAWWGLGDLVGRFLYLSLMLGLGAIPNVLFNLPVSFVAQRWASHEQKKALKGSSVKLAARDVLMSYQIIYVMGLVPLLYFFYIAFLVVVSGWSYNTIALFALAVPVFSFCGIKASEQGVRAYMDLLPLFMRLRPGLRREQNALPVKRANLAKNIRKEVRKLREQLGDQALQ